MYIELKNINKSFGDFKASKDVSFGIEKGKLVALLGPSGSGKTTILRMIAGLEHQDSGDIWIDGKLVNDLSVQNRDIGFVFQSYALFPYLTVYDNIAYGMKLRKKSKQEIEKNVTHLLELVGLPGLGDRFPQQLSGGQRQRVAFARALAIEPQVLLLDEPFAAIDAKVRKELRRWLKELIRQVGITSIFVTHDQDEAVEVADQIIITNEGRVEQDGDPKEIYRNPKTPFVAQFIGESVILNNFRKLKGFERCEYEGKAAVRPEFVRVKNIHSKIEYPNSYQKAKVVATAFRGNDTELTVEINGEEIIANYPLDDEQVCVGDEIWILVTRVIVFNNESAKVVESDAFQSVEYNI